MYASSRVSVMVVVKSFTSSSHIHWEIARQLHVVVMGIHILIHVSMHTVIGGSVYKVMLCVYMSGSIVSVRIVVRRQRAILKFGITAFAVWEEKRRL